jgi:3-dehydroquinate synthase
MKYIMKQIEVSLPEQAPSSYPIQIGSERLQTISSILPKGISTLVIITDNKVKKLYGNILQALLTPEYKTLLLSFPAGEKSKTNHTKSKLEKKMLESGCDRNSLILALGGGVVGDLAGFVAATYMRGIPYIQIPTTLLAMLDSSVGGKTGIDTPQGKNLIGAFWQPIAVISDIDCLKTLPKQHMINGLIEALKMFLTSDANSLTFAQQHLELILNYDTNTLIELIHRAIKIKSRIVASDPCENSQRAILNFGHTIGHALEHLSQFQLLHGYAVALGLLVEAKISELMGLLEAKHYLYIKSFLNQLGIQPSELNQFDVNQVIKCTQLDKKNRAGVVNYVLLTDLGQTYEIANKFAHPVPNEIVKNAFLELALT